ncbi:NACHT and Ankyrin domain protein [Aspergillus mulundensis]|uniref:Uncharacterized protein n=1 Tax=Aspergillus mulundensis TaxID=1810919 RepID=A0A3D8R4Y7_9EURO|nr:hypothetical protein DSM5745_08849 [Aspergillus mulundensis]RDW69089.1 hypothetical protein DSM5745_08849 [Aspergillus mulundensis]
MIVLIGKLKRVEILTKKYVEERKTDAALVMRGRPACVILPILLHLFKPVLRLGHSGGSPPALSFSPKLTASTSTFLHPRHPLPPRPPLLLSPIHDRYKYQRESHPAQRESMTDVQGLRGQLAQAAGSARVVVRCLNGGRDLQESSQRAIMLLVDMLDALYRLKDQMGDTDNKDNKWLVQPHRLAALAEILECFASTMKSMELYFQPGGVGVTYYRKHLLERTFLERLEQYKVMLLLSMQPDSSCTPSDVLRKGPKVNLQFEDRILGITSQLTTENFIMLADLYNRRLKGTGQWIFDDEQYKRWLLGGTKTLYCVGPPGAGKTFLSAAIIDSLQRTFTSPDVATVFIFCQDERQRELSTLDILQNILAQLVYRKRSLSYASSSLYHSESIMNGKASPKVYQNAIRAEVDRFSKVFFVIDGLDMLSDKERLLGRLQKLPDQVQHLVTLREVNHVSSASRLTVLAPNTDLQLYAISRIESDSSLGDLLKRKSTPQMYQDVVNMVAEKSHGVFLLAKIHLDLLARYTHKSLFERALIHLPQSLSEAYGEAMKQVVSESPRAASYVYWTLYAHRPLTVGELKSATNSSGSPTNDKSMSFEHSLQTQTAGILTVDAVSGTVRFVHRTAKEYLTGTPSRVFFPSAQKDIAEACLTAITPDEVVDDCYYNGGNPPRSSSRGFLSYATRYWGFHAREVHEDEQTIQVLIKTFLNKLLWRRPPLQVLTNEPKIPSELGLGKYPQDWTALHVLAYFGIVSRCRRLITQGARIDAGDNSYRLTPLHCAASRGHSEMVEFLLENGADGNAMARDGSTALHLATQYGQRKVMKILLHHPVNAQVANLEGATSLQLAVKTEADEATVPLLIKNKVDVDTRNIRTGDTALHLAIEWRRPRIILYLLDKGASIDMTNEDGFTPLQLAVKSDNCEAISVLLQRRANIEARSLSGLTALQIAAYEEHWIAFDLLIIGGADINAWNKEGESLIHEQARKATSPSIASKLLDQGANIEALTAKGLTPLHCAAVGSNKTMFLFLISRGAKPTALTAKGDSLLHITLPVLKEGFDILRLALNYGNNVNTVSNEGWTPLHQAVYVGTGSPDHEFPQIAEYIQLLVSRGADINARLQAPTNNGETPLHLAVTAIVTRPDLVQLLLQSGADMNAPTADGKTPLHLAAERGREAIFRILYDAGADMSLEAPDSAKADDGHDGQGVGHTAFDIALKNPFARQWFESDGKLKPAVNELKRKDSVETLIDEDELNGEVEPVTEREGAAATVGNGKGVDAAIEAVERPQEPLPSDNTTNPVFAPRKSGSRSGSMSSSIRSPSVLSGSPAHFRSNSIGGVLSPATYSDSTSSLSHLRKVSRDENRTRKDDPRTYKGETRSRKDEAKSRKRSRGSGARVRVELENPVSVPRSGSNSGSGSGSRSGSGDGDEEAQKLNEKRSSISLVRNETPYVIV